MQQAFNQMRMENKNKYINMLMCFDVIPKQKYSDDEKGLIYQQYINLTLSGKLDNDEIRVQMKPFVERIIVSKHFQAA